MNRRRVASLLAALATLASSRAAAAYPSALLDESLLGPRLDQIDPAPHELFVDVGEPVEGQPWTRTPKRRGAPGLWVSIDVGYVHATGAPDVLSGSILFGGPTDHILRAITSPRADQPKTPASGATALADGPTKADDEEPALKPAPRTPRRARGDAAPPPSAPTPKVPATAPVTERIEVPIVITPGVARGAVKAALKRASLYEPATRTDALASRARTSALLPELRLRAARIVDDGQSLMPTEYDPYRTEATGGTTTWLDARATWRLDRLVFGEEEVALERIRNERIEAQGRLVNRVLEALFAWQKAEAHLADQNATPEEHLAAELASYEAEAELDLLTGGWFTAWRAARKAK
ncbi:MAG TPA: hypothetical protein VGM56_18750 [Byssovorax sp.]|jgi:hypothetical protein